MLGDVGRACADAQELYTACTHMLCVLVSQERESQVQEVRLIFRYTHRP
jgi:hypothetical protein